MKNNIRVKLVSRGSVDKDILGFLNQTIHNSGKLGVCEFIFNSFERNYDWLVIIDDIPRALKKSYEELACSIENTILVTTEPSTITRYGKNFASQFKYLITNQDEKILPHKRALRSQTGNVWMYGKNYDDIINMDIPNKNKNISTVCSNKQQGHTLHKKRYNFTLKLQREIPEIARFGWGYKPIDTKVEALDNFKFHVCIENHIGKDVWTEKIADAFLAYCLPIYYGCPNILDYFPKDSIILIDLDDFDSSIEKIKTIINTPGEYEKRLEFITEARELLIHKYNLLEMINNIVEKNNKSDNLTKNIKIFNRRTMRGRSISDFTKFVFWKIENFLKSKLKTKRTSIENK
ncbi:MAG: glycosyltransferase family 10 domain-containing protein [Arcobacter sp.]|uniref:glycosyltransferase family 10 domain-containing protein n=1 Tax=Arcobacter sp. TaxID=1872629 RepID=UPI003B00C286